eukprot:CAMPEP_0204202242 /NCGR_PEP_ID=MMETSP0361-20130328/68071_1 /ASSEMBLY_ACC=CAM_ASM_000343 /TAXON_ID=268821 /ORGANISM="Scrippsiella Hangoei, Strain SHTV-5" /LENGTH=57 /DNA_ID=CAMNT_0051165019 /DNA_START=84 /DNA_END=257 /DNA_ORIENTATION=+
MTNVKPELRGSHGMAKRMWACPATMRHNGCPYIWKWLKVATVPVKKPPHASPNPWKK